MNKLLMENNTMSDKDGEFLHFEPEMDNDGTKSKAWLLGGKDWNPASISVNEYRNKSKDIFLKWRTRIIGLTLPWNVC